MSVLHGGETETGTLYHGRSRTDQRLSGCTFYHCISMGTAGCGGSYRHRTVHRRPASHPLFRPPQHQSAPTDKNAFGRRRTIESMYQRFFGTDEQCLHFPCQHAVQCPAVTLRRRRWSRRLRRVNVCQSDLPVRLYRFFRRRLAGGRLSQWRRKL